MLTYQDNVFRINGEEMFIWGGELHYFRVHKEDWKSRIQAIKDAGFNLISTYIPWIWHESTEGEIDLVGTTSKETNLVEFIQLVKEAGMYLLVRPGPYVMAETVNAGLPLWLIENYPEIRAKKEDGSYHNNRGLVSYMHPTFLQYVKQWYTEVFRVLVPQEINNGGPIILTQYDNEVGMFHWVTQQGDYSPTTLDYFKQYLKNNGLDAYVKQVDSFVKNETNSDISVCINQEYKKFFRFYIKTYLEELISYATEMGSITYPVINVHGFSSVDYGKRGNRYPVGLSQLYETTSIKNCILAGDYYVGNIVSDNFFDVIIANSFTKAIQPKGQPLFSAEFQSGFQNGIPRLQPTTHDLKTRLTIANGMNAINYYMFVGGENFKEIGLISRRHDWQAPIGMDGSKRRHYYIIKRIVDVLDTYGKALLNASYQTETTFGFYPDYFMTEFNNNHTLNQTNHITNARKAYIFNGIGKSLAMNNIGFDSIDLQENTPINIKQHPTLIVFSTKWMDEFIQQKLVDYMKDGGHLLLYPTLPDSDLLGNECNILSDAIGIKAIKQEYQRVHILNNDSVNCNIAEVYDVSDGYATLDLDHSAYTATVKVVGKGQINLFGMGIRSQWDYIDTIMNEVFALSNIAVPFKTKEWINICVRKSDLGQFYFIHNFEEFTKTTTITYNETAIFDNHTFTIPFRKGVILPENWKVTNDFLIEYSTCEVYKKEINDDSLMLSVEALSDNEKIKFKGDYHVIEQEGLHVEDNIIYLEKGDHTITWKK